MDRAFFFFNLKFSSEAFPKLKWHQFWNDFAFKNDQTKIWRQLPHKIERMRGAPANIFLTLRSQLRSATVCAISCERGARMLRGRAPRAKSPFVFAKAIVFCDFVHVSDKGVDGNIRGIHVKLWFSVRAESAQLLFESVVIHVVVTQREQFKESQIETERPVAPVSTFNVATH